MVAKRWDSRIYDISEILNVLDSVIKGIELPSKIKPKKYSIELILKVLVKRVFECLTKNR